MRKDTGNLAMTPHEIEGAIPDAFSNAEIEFQGHDGTHFHGLPVDERFRGIKASNNNGL